MISYSYRVSVSTRAVIFQPKLLASMLALCTPALLSSCATGSLRPSVAMKDHERLADTSALKMLFAASDEAYLQRNPIQALYRGEERNTSHFGDYVSAAYFEAERAAAKADLARLSQIDRNLLSFNDQIAFDVFKWRKEMELRRLQPEILALTAVRPLDHFFGFHIFFPQINSGQGAAPFRDLSDYEDALKRMDGFVIYLDRSIGRFREGMLSGVTQPKLVVRNIIAQADALVAKGVEDSPLFGPVRQFPEEIAPVDRKRLRDEFAASIQNKVIPAYARLSQFLREEYLPVARGSVGLVDMKGGEQLYQLLVEANTTIRISPDQIHRTGLSEVERLRGEMEKVKQQVGFTGTLPAFFEHLRTDPNFKPQSKEDLRARYLAVGERVDARIGELFSTIPRSRLEIRPMPDHREKTAAAGSYQYGTADGSRPGVFYYNTYDLPSRNIITIETLYLHEAVPGHHFQTSLALENSALPAFMRFDGPNAFLEGWGLYAETLGLEIGMFADPYQYFGHLDDQMLRALRLVVDTGIHAKGWSRDRAIAFMMENSSMGRTDAVAEVERYIAIPGQALSYKIGALKMQELRARAERELGSRFDVRDFHAQVLLTGALPLAVLEAKIDRWIASTK